MAEPRTTQWDREAKYLPNGLPANMEAVLADQYRRAVRDGRILRDRGGNNVG